MNLYWPFYIRWQYKVHVFSILYGHINVPTTFKELQLQAHYCAYKQINCPTSTIIVCTPISDRMANNNKLSHVCRFRVMVMFEVWQ